MKKKGVKPSSSSSATLEDKPPSPDGQEESSQIPEEVQRMRAEKAATDQALARDVMSASSSLVRSSNGLPRSGNTFELLQSYGSFANLVKQQEARVTSLLSRVLASAGSRTRLPRHERDFEHFFDRVVEANDGIVERAGLIIDELDRTLRGQQVKVPRAVIDAESTRRTLAGHGGLLSGVSRSAPTIDTSAAADPTGFKFPIRDEAPHSQGTLYSARLQREGEMRARISTGTAKPQKSFRFANLIDNTTAPFVPRLRTKHHAIEKKRADGIVLRSEEEDSGGAVPWRSDEAEEVHPYGYELDHWNVPEDQLKSAPAKEPLPLAETSLIFVDTLDKLQSLVTVLNGCKEFAVDLEAHSHRSFAGLTCLMQLSTRQTDYIVDPFPIWEHMHLLNEPFSHPNILKVFHGSDSDVLWLQRDFGIFTQNLFDTYRAMKRDGSFAKLSLAHLVAHFCGVVMAKEYQLADWRVRPLPSEQMDYARADTHYLLYCADLLREKLIEAGNEHNNLLRATYTDGVNLCRKLYAKPSFDAQGYHALIGTRRSFNNRQLFALSELWKWRDTTARIEDESLHYVLPNHMMLHIAEALPREMQGILACCSPVPLLVKQNALALHRIIYAARDRPLEKSVTLSDRSVIGGHGEDGRSLFDTIVDEANRMTKMKAMLRSHLDFSHTSYNEEIGAYIKRADDDKKERVCEKASESTFLSVIGVISAEDRRGLTAETEATNMKSIIAQFANIKSGLEEWATPFERYSIAVQDNEKKNAEKRLAEEARRKERGNVDEQGRRLYSHHDPAVCRKPIFEQDAVNEDDININRGGDDDSLSGSRKSKTDGPSWNEEDILTKKKLKLLNKKRRAAADVSTVPPPKKAMVKKEGRVKKEELKEDGEVVNEEETEEKTDKQSFDYSQYDAHAMFDQSQSEANSQSYQPPRWDQGKRGGRGGHKSGGRGRNRGGHSLTRAFGISFKPRGRK